MAASIAIIAITTSSSISVKAFLDIALYLLLNGVGYREHLSISHIRNQHVRGDSVLKSV
jgi:hypothetical protein